MSRKIELINIVLDELRLAQTAIWKPPQAGVVKQLSFPPSLPLDSGRQLSATDALLKAVAAYSRLYLDNHPLLKAKISEKDFGKLTRKTFGNPLQVIDLSLSNDDHVKELIAAIDTSLKQSSEISNQNSSIILGCHLFQGDDAYPLHVGPVSFEDRFRWTHRLLEEKNISRVTARRLEARWSGKRLAQRKPTFDSLAEDSLFDSVGNCPIVCTVSTSGLSGDYIKKKGILAARLAMTVIALLWERPSNGLEWMNLLYDRRVPHRHTATFYQNGHVGSSSESTQISFGRRTDDELIEHISQMQWLFDTAGRVIRPYVQPDYKFCLSKLGNALFLSLWWLHEACREPLDQIATIKFAASLDSLAACGKSKGIGKLIKARLGFRPEDPILTDGTPTKTIVKKIYDDGRSQLIHGSSSDYFHDWSELRSVSEFLSRSCLIECLHLLSKNPKTDNVEIFSSA